MDKRFYRKLACLVKTEVTYGTDAAPTGAANAMQLKDVTLTPYAGDQANHDFLLTYLGNQGVEMVGSYAQIEGSVELAGSGTAGVVPAYGPLLTACALSETVTADTSVEYDPVSDAFDSASIYFNADGVNHILLGARGTVQLTMTPKQIPVLKFTMTGLLGTITDTALPTADLSAFLKALPVSMAVTTLSLHQHACAAESVSIDIGNTVTPTFLIGLEEIDITDRSSSGSAVVRAEKIGTIDWFGAAKAETLDALSLVHGTDAGNIVTISAPKVQIGRPTQGNTNGILNYTLPLMLVPDAGNDEVKLMFT